MPSLWFEPAAYRLICRFWLSISMWPLENSTNENAESQRGVGPVFLTRTSHSSTSSSTGMKTVCSASIPEYSALNFEYESPCLVSYFAVSSGLPTGCQLTDQ